MWPWEHSGSNSKVPIRNAEGMDIKVRTVMKIRLTVRAETRTRSSKESVTTVESVNIRSINTTRKARNPEEKRGKSAINRIDEEYQANEQSYANDGLFETNIEN